MIKYINSNQLYNDFFQLIIELECGNHYDKNNSQHESWIRHRVNYLEQHPGKIIALYEKDNPIGFLFVLHDKGLNNVKCFGKKAEVIMFGLYEMYRSKGYGKLLINECEKYITENGGECIYVNTYASNSKAIRFYSQNGFIPIGYHPYENGIDDVGQVYLCKKLNNSAQQAAGADK